MLRRALSTMVIAVVVMIATSGALASSSPATRTGADRLAAAVLDGTASDVMRTLPSDFGTRLGYRPTTETDPSGVPVAVRPDGDCSSPLGGTRYGFDQACRAHDLGYDVLRYAALRGTPLATGVRRAVDARFGDAMRAVCTVRDRGDVDRLGCLAAAGAYEAAVVLNSWRQAFGAPLAGEALGPWLGLGGAVVLLGAGAFVSARLRSRDILTSRYLPAVRARLA